MGRKILTGENPSIHPILSLSLLVAYMAAIVALISSLCISRKKVPPPTDSEQNTTENLNAASPPPNETTTRPSTTEATILEPPSTTVIEVEETKNASQQPRQTTEEPPPQVQLPLPPPPGLRGVASCHYRTSSTQSESKLLSSMSTRVQGIGMSFRQQSKREDPNDKKRDKKLKHEDSIWKKTIILGEKCRVPDEDDVILYDEKGNRIPTFHTKTPGSLPVSRQTSFKEPDAIPNKAEQK
ncbi:hypothetical protein ACSBR2_037208 [Camellia fascicularis]